MTGTNLIQSGARRAMSLFCAVCVLSFTSFAPAFAQDVPNAAAPLDSQQPVTLLNADQLSNLVAPIALYPDPLLGQTLAASTYPLELVEAQQWLQQNGSLHGQDLMNAAKQQNWDPSVQALVAFPDALSMLNRDIRWTTDLGNAYLAQQKDVMDAVQRMRVRAQQNGKLTSTPQQTVTTQAQDGQSAVVIDPADPQVVYVPTYNPAYVWGPPVWGYYPPLWYPTVGFGFGFGPGIYVGGFFPAWAGLGWGGWGPGWGWGCGWFGGGIFVNHAFFDHYGFHGYWGGARFAGGHEGWVHDSFHRSGVPYANGAVAAHYNNARFAEGRTLSANRSFNNGNAGRSFNQGAGATQRSSAPNGSRSFNNGSAGERSSAAPNRSSNSGGGWQRFNNGNRGGGTSSGSPQASTRGLAPSPQTGTGVTSRSTAGGNYSRSSYNSPGQSFRGGSSASSSGGAARSFSAPSSGGGSARSFSAPRSSGGGGFSGGGHSSGGGHGGRR